VKPNASAGNPGLFVSPEARAIVWRVQGGRGRKVLDSDIGGENRTSLSLYKSGSVLIVCLTSGPFLQGGGEDKEAADET
jgi:hypothetical protein